jgi:hypothetical protein
MGNFVSFDCMKKTVVQRVVGAAGLTAKIVFLRGS